MRVTVIGHAGLYIESGDATVLVDPWLSGSCYWRSWWHFPPSPAPEDDWLHPTYLYLTHHHFDHFHYPSLRRISRDTRVLIPRFGNDVMPKELARLGFSEVVEMPHGRTFELGRLDLTSFQYGFDDSALVVVDPDATVVDLNDCKLRSDDLRGLRARFGRPDLMLKSHSWAQGYPNCYTAEDPADLELLSRQSYVADFLDSTRALEPRDAAPFASMVCFLHPETWERNGDVVTPVEVADAFERDPVVGTRLILMKPGDRWEHHHPFTSDPGDFYTNRSSWLEKLREEAAPAVVRSLQDEAERSVSPAELTAYFTGFLRSVPRAAGLMVRRPVVLKVRDREGYCVLDWRRRRARMEPELPDHYASLIEVPAGVLAGAVADHIVHFVHISMRFRGRLGRQGVTTDFAFWTLLTMWELGYLPLRRLLTPRFGAAAWRRRSEIIGMARTALGGRGPMAARMTSRFMSDE
ncbi:MAG TPA: MBL fold metallo-hydrolase [Acidimicrobiales bacterium]|nr:MBL fold metallo-hydrolase [Acidimicrobiales bacterium]